MNAPVPLIFKPNLDRSHRRRGESDGIHNHRHERTQRTQRFGWYLFVLCALLRPFSDPRLLSKLLTYQSLAQNPHNPMRLTPPGPAGRSSGFQRQRVYSLESSSCDSFEHARILSQLLLATIRIAPKVKGGSCHSWIYHQHSSAVPRLGNFSESTAPVCSPWSSPTW